MAAATHIPVSEYLRTTYRLSVGAKVVWVIDPWRRVAYEESVGGLIEPKDGMLRVEGTPIEVSIEGIFHELDEF